MTPRERRAKYPLVPVTPMSAVELDELEQRTAEWLREPTFTSATLDRTYLIYARLLATIREALGLA